MEKIKDLEMPPHDIAKIPAASLWELCRSFDEEMGKSPKGINSGLRIFEYYKQQMSGCYSIISIRAKGGH